MLRRRVEDDDNLPAGGVHYTVFSLWKGVFPASEKALRVKVDCLHTRRRSAGSGCTKTVCNICLLAKRSGSVP